MEKDILTNLNNTIKYKSNVKVEVIKQGKKVKTLEKHNTATNILFNFLYDCLAGNYIQNNRPNYVVPLVESTDEGHTIYTLYNNIYNPITNIIVDTNESILSYKCLIGYNSLYDSTKKIVGLAFYSNGRKNLDNTVDAISNESMYVIFDDEFQPDGESDLLITWQIKIEDIGSIEDSNN